MVSSNWWFESAFDAYGLLRGAKSGQVYYSSGDGRAAFVTRTDHAEVLARVLVSDRYETGRVQVNGPESLSLPDVIALTSEVAGVPVAGVAVSHEERVKALEQAGLPTLIAELLVGFDRLIRQGKFEGSDAEAAQWLGRKPTSVREYLQQRASELKAAAASAGSA